MKPDTQPTIEKALGSLEAVKQAGVSAGFTQKVLARIENAKTALRVVPRRTVWAVAASIAVLFALNVWISSGYKANTKQQAGKSAQQMAGEMGLGPQGFWY